MAHQVIEAAQVLEAQQILSAAQTLVAAEEIGVLPVLGGGGGPPPPPAYGYTAGVEFDGPASDGLNQRMNTGRTTPAGTSSFTQMLVFELDIWHGSILATQWSDIFSDSSWIIAPSSDGDYGPGSNGLRLWIQDGGAIIACQATIDPLPAAGTRVQVVVRYDGTAVGNAGRARIWLAVGSDPTLVEATLTFFQPFGPASVPATINASPQPFYVEGRRTRRAGHHGPDPRLGVLECSPRPLRHRRSPSRGCAGRPGDDPTDRQPLADGQRSERPRDLHRGSRGGRLGRDAPDGRQPGRPSADCVGVVAPPASSASGCRA